MTLEEVGTIGEKKKKREKQFYIADNTSVECCNPFDRTKRSDKLRRKKEKKKRV